MPKDKIFTNRPKRKKSSVITYPSLSSGTFRKDQINLSDYRKLAPDERVEKGDIYDKGNLYATSLLAGRRQEPNLTYYRQTTKTKRPYVDPVQFIKLFKFDILQEDDEFFDEETNDWYKTQEVGNTSPNGFIYRRRVKNFSDEELEAADRCYLPF